MAILYPLCLMSFCVSISHQHAAEFDGDHASVIDLREVEHNADRDDGQFNISDDVPFEELDIDRDDKLSKDELLFGSSYGRPHDFASVNAFLYAHWKDADSDRSGFIERSEFPDLVRLGRSFANQRTEDEVSATVFEEWDTNHDGKLSIDEFAQNDHELSHFYKYRLLIDTNGDLAVDRDEFPRLLESIELYNAQVE